MTDYEMKKAEFIRKGINFVIELQTSHGESLDPNIEEYDGKATRYLDIYRYYPNKKIIVTSFAYTFEGKYLYHETYSF